MMVAFNVKFRPVPQGNDVVYVFIPGQINCFYIRPDWKEHNNLMAKAITYLGRRASAIKTETSGQKEIWIGCSLFDFLFEQPAFTIVDFDDLEKAQEKIIQVDHFRKKRKIV